MNNQAIRAAAVIVVALCFSCRPVKQVQRQEEDIQALKAKWAVEWVKDHPCPLLPPMNLDSLCTLKDFAFDMEQRDTLKHDTIANPCSPVYRRILVPYEDTRMVDLLYDSLRAKTERIVMLEGEQDAHYQDTAMQVAAIKGSRNTWLWAFIAACVVIACGIGWRVYKFFQNPLSIIK